MPIYGWTCAKCGNRTDIICSIAEYDTRQGFCEDCDLPMQREFSTPAVIKDCAPFQSMVDGSTITSKTQYRDHLKRHNCVEVGNDLKPKPRDTVRGDFDVRRDLTAATREVMARHG